MATTVLSEKETIFIVDDNPANLDILLNMLRSEDYYIRVMTSGPLALSAIKLRPPDLILLDINMPGMDGYEVCEKLKANTATCNIPVIFISALGEVMDKVKAFKVGGVDYITKPFHFEEVLVRIENQLRSLRLMKQLEYKNAALARKNQELIKSQQKANLIFSVLSKNLYGNILDNKYKLESQIGSGGFGVVYRATNLLIQREVAIKIFQPKGTIKESDLEQFQQEAISSCRVQHPNAISILDFGITDDGLPYLVMELLKGHNLKEELTEKIRFSLTRAIEIIIPICDVLAEVHAKGIVHRDIKPENIFLHKETTNEIVKVLDFGIAKLAEEEDASAMTEATPYGKLLGTPTYMAPERLSGLPYDGRADIYSLGIMLHQMLCGEVPFRVSEGQSWLTLIDLHRNNPPKSLRDIDPSISKAVEDIVLKTLAKKPEDRPTANQLASWLKEL